MTAGFPDFGTFAKALRQLRTQRRDRVLLDRKGRISRARLAHRTGCVLAAVLSLAGLLYAHHLANKFDREWGPKDKPPAE